MKSELNDDNLSIVKDYFNIVLVGNPSVGKTSILEKYVNNAFQANLENKKLIEIYKKQICLYTNSYKLKFWDITKLIGNNDISELDMFYNCDGIIFVSSYDDKSSLENLNIWYQLLIEYVDLSTKEMVWLINKKDLNEGKVLTEEQIEKKSKDLQLDYYEVSAKSGENIEEGIKKVVKKLILRCNDIEENDDNSFESSTADSANSLDIEEGKNCTIF
jgi:small GTP-binding protein